MVYIMDEIVRNRVIINRTQKLGWLSSFHSGHTKLTTVFKISSGEHVVAVIVRFPNSFGIDQTKNISIFVFVITTHRQTYRGLVNLDRCQNGKSNNKYACAG